MVFPYTASFFPMVTPFVTIRQGEATDRPFGCFVKYERAKDDANDNE